MKIYAFADEASSFIDKQIEALKSNCLDGLEIRNVDNVNVSEISAAKAKEVRAKLDAAGLIVWSVGSPIGKIDIEKDDFYLHTEKFRRTLETAEILGAENIRIFSFYIPKDRNPHDYTNKVIERLGIFAEYAKECGITLCHENEKGIYGDNAERCLDILSTLPEIKGIFDPANFVQCGQDTLEAWESLNKYIKYMHIKDALMDGSVVPAGKGEGNVKIIAEKYLADGKESFTIEPHLTVFSGLSQLEQNTQESIIGKYSYRSNEEAFKAATDSFKQLMEV